MSRARRFLGVLVVACVAPTAMWLTGPTVRAGSDDIAGTVRGPQGPEAGVWVIAETTNLPSKLTKIVVTDAGGKYVLPDLPSAGYDVWVRGYGLADSEKKRAKPGDTLAFTVKQPASPQEAASIYPSNYWYSLLQIPEAGEFPGTGQGGNGIAPGMRTQAHWIDRLKDGCELCHQMGNKATREMPMLDLGKFPSAKDAWELRINAGTSGPLMMSALNRLGPKRAIDMYAGWSDLIKGGALPLAPPRPQGKERNVVITMWNWGNPRTVVHDEIVTDKRNPTLYANGPVYGLGGSAFVVLDPKTHTSKMIDMKTRVPMRFEGDSYQSANAQVPSLYWGHERAPGTPVSGHNPMMDDKGRVWITQVVRPGAANPDWCKEGSTHASATYFPIPQNAIRRQLSYFDSKSGSFELIDTCYGTHHLQFGRDDTLWLSGDSNVIGWLDTKQYDKTKDERASQAWCPTVIDTNGDGKITKPWNEPNATTIDPTKDTRIASFNYGIIPNPKDGSVWVGKPGPMPGSLVRLELGSNPPETCRTEVFEPPFQNAAVDQKQWGFGPRGIDIDTSGLIWTALGGSGHIASFDRSKCKVLNGPKATGQHCPQGWTLYPTPGPSFRGVSGAITTDFHYYNWVDQFNTLGLGENIPIANGTGSDSLIALDPKTREMITMRVPYPLGFYTRGLDGRIDDPKAGWKGRGVWASYDSFNWHNEGGRGTLGAAVRFQMRPNPLAE
ncbi:MAG: carboxypeptidase regulatory-like domain-containing protein [Acidimicrobiia bacterium]|nr:carboxypeptidase regulatory-like domain-containing protein [Acidimicrobiia bacterium]